MTAPTLLPCPFCGEVPKIENITFCAATKWGAVHCCCVGPEVRTGYRDVDQWRDEAIEEWNIRASEDALRAEVERLTKALCEVALERPFEGAGQTRAIDYLQGIARAALAKGERA